MSKPQTLPTRRSCSGCANTCSMQHSLVAACFCYSIEHIQDVGCRLVVQYSVTVAEAGTSTASGATSFRRAAASACSTPSPISPASNTWRCKCVGWVYILYTCERMVEQSMHAPGSISFDACAGMTTPHTQGSQLCAPCQAACHPACAPVHQTRIS